MTQPSEAVWARDCSPAAVWVQDYKSKSSRTLFLLHVSPFLFISVMCFLVYQEQEKIHCDVHLRTGYKLTKQCSCNYDKSSKDAKMATRPPDDRKHSQMLKNNCVIGVRAYIWKENRNQTVKNRNHSRRAVDGMGTEMPKTHQPVECDCFLATTQLGNSSFAVTITTQDESSMTIPAKRFLVCHVETLNYVYKNKQTNRT